MQTSDQQVMGVTAVFHRQRQQLSPLVMASDGNLTPLDNKSPVSSFISHLWQTTALTFGASNLTFAR
jgi:hypothetical protein